LVVVGSACLLMIALFSPSVECKKTSSSSSSSFYDFDSKAEIPGSASSMLDDLSVTESDRKSAKDYIDICHNRPRVTYFTSNNSFLQRPARLLLYEDPEDLENGDFDYMAYGESIVLMVAPVVAVVILFIPSAIVYFSLRCCTCGTYKPTRKFCGGEEIKEKDWVDGVDGYKIESTVGLQVAACLAGVVVVAGAIIVEVGNRSVTSNFDGAVGYINKTVIGLVGTLNNTLDAVERLNEKYGDVVDAGGLMDTLDAARDIGANLETYDGYINDYYPMVNKPRQLVLLILMLIPCISVVFLILGAFIGFPCFSCTSVILACISIPICLLLFGIHYPIGNAVSDVCYFIDRATDVTSPDYYEYLASFYRCDDTSPIGNITSVLDHVLDEAIATLCDNLTEICNTSIPCDRDMDGEVAYSDRENVTCPVLNCDNRPAVCDESTLNETIFSIMVYNFLINCFNVTNECHGTSASDPDPLCLVRDDFHGNIKDVDASSCSEGDVEVPKGSGRYYRSQYPLISGYYKHDSAPITLDKCTKECQITVVKEAAEKLVKYRDIFSEVWGILEDIRSYLRCSTIVGILYHVEDFTCVKVMNSLRPLTSGSLAVAVGLMAVVVVGTLGAKRFNRKYRFHFVPMVEDDGLDVEMGNAAGAAAGDGEDNSKPLQTTVVEYVVSDGEEDEEDASQIEIQSEEEEEEE